MQHSSPRIGITFAEPGKEYAQEFCDLLKSFGLTPVVLDVERSYPDYDLEGLNGIIITGGPHINPKEYGEPLHTKTMLPKTPERGTYENRLMQLALEQNIPLLAICAGMQRLNIGNHAADKGTLLQSIVDENNSIDHEPFGSLGWAAHSMGVVEGSRLDAIVKRAYEEHKREHTNPAYVPINSRHKQSVKTVRKGFVPSGIGEDWIVEAIEPDPQGAYADRYALGLQWHPEKLATSDKTNPEATYVAREIFKDFARACQNHLTGHKECAASLA